LPFGIFLFFFEALTFQSNISDFWCNYFGCHKKSKKCDTSGQSPTESDKVDPTRPKCPEWVENSIKGHF